MGLVLKQVYLSEEVEELLTLSLLIVALHRPVGALWDDKEEGRLQGVDVGHPLDRREDFPHH